MISTNGIDFDMISINGIELNIISINGTDFDMISVNGIESDAISRNEKLKLFVRYQCRVLQEVLCEPHRGGSLEAAHL